MDIFELNFEDWAEVSYVYETGKKKHFCLRKHHGQSNRGREGVLGSANNLIWWSFSTLGVARDEASVVHVCAC